MTARLLIPIAPALGLMALFLAGLVGFAVWTAFRGYPDLPGADRRETTAIATPFMIRYILWFLTPIERGLVATGVSPNTISYMSLAVCLGTGVAAATSHFAIAAWTYAGAGMLDILDGRVARRSGKTSAAGALLDSVLDRWGEFFVLGGCALALRDTYGLVAVLLCIAGSQMVSYTRARGEGMGTKLSGGTMQRAERIVVVGVAMLAASIGRHTGAFNGESVLATSLLGVGVFSATTSLFRLVKGMNDLHDQDPDKAAAKVRAEQQRKAADARGSGKKGPTRPALKDA